MKPISPPRRPFDSAKAVHVICLADLIAISLSASIFLHINPVLAQPILWNANDGGNGHYYERVSTRTGWTCARQLAEERMFESLPGHLATITSQGELDFFRDNFLNQQFAWLGGFQDVDAADYYEPDGGWKWVTGEKWDFTAWSTTEVGGNDDEPDNAGDERYLSSEESITSEGERFFGWNDSGSTRVSGFFVEYEHSGLPNAAVEDTLRGVTVDIRAFIDGRDQLIMQGDTLQWHHFDFAAVGRHSGRDEPTSITTRQSDTVIMNEVAWFPEWSEPPPDEIRQEEVSSIFESLNPPLPATDLRVDLLSESCDHGGGTGTVTIAQYPDATNDYTLIVEFDDNGAVGSAFYDLSILLSVPGDVSGDLVLDVTDIDALANAVREGTFSALFDLNSDGVLDGADYWHWVHNLAKTYFGDADLDGEFASSDLVSVFQAGQYEDSIVGNSTWATGDWNGDGDFTSGDLVFAFQAAGYEQGPRVASRVPEPGSLVGLFCACLLAGTIVPIRRRCCEKPNLEIGPEPEIKP
jgi:hypothetical protein